MPKKTKITALEILNIHTSATHITCNRVKSGKHIFLWYGNKPKKDTSTGQWVPSTEFIFGDCIMYNNPHSETIWPEMPNWKKRIISKEVR